MTRLFLLILLTNFAFCADFTALCNKLKNNANEIFASKEHFDDLTDYDFECEDEFLKPFYEIAFAVRGINVDCDGQNAIKTMQNFRFFTQKALYAPRLYQQNLLDSNTSDKVTKNDRDYFRYWAYKNLTSFELYTKFNEIYKESVPKLVKFYEEFHHFKSDEAIYFANKTANGFLNFVTENHHNLYKLSKLEEFVASKNLTASALMDFLYAENFSDNDLTNALNIAILEGHNEDILKILISRGAHINQGNESAIFSALRRQNIVEFLIKNGAELDYKNAFGKTPIFYAVEFSDFSLVKLFAENGANLDAKYISNNEKTALINENRFPFYVKLCGINHTSRTLLMHAAQKSNIEIVKFLISKGVNINAYDDLGYNALDYAIMGEKPQIAEYLASLGLKERENYE